MRIHKIIQKTRANGPGLRFGIWVQGCSIQCPGCINPQTHEILKGKQMAVGTIIGQIKRNIQQLVP